MNTRELVGEVFRETGVALEPGDPVLVSAAIARIVSEEERGEVQRLLTAARGVLEKAEARTISPEVEQAFVDRLGKEAARVMNIHAVQYLRAGSLRNVLIAAGVLFAVALACIGGGYWWGYRNASAEHLLQTCQGGEVQQKDGRRYCVMAVWLDPAPARR